MTLPCRLYLITPPALDDLAGFGRQLAKALEGGDVAALQIRLKDVSDDVVKAAVDVLAPIAQARDVAVILNDRPDLAARLPVDGVHVGQSDMAYRDARKLMGERMVGVVTHVAALAERTPVRFLVSHDNRTSRVEREAG